MRTVYFVFWGTKNVSRNKTSSMKPETAKKLNAKIKLATKNNEQSVFLKDLKDAKKSRKQSAAETALSKYNSWKRS